MTIKVLVGDCQEVLKTLADESVHCIVTSPPYWGLRDYGVEGQIGMERTLGEHISVMVDVFRECRRILRKDGTLWLNYGDCYATSPNGRSAADTKKAGDDDRTFRDKPFSTIGPINRSKNRETKRWGGGSNPGGPICDPHAEKSDRHGKSGNKGGGDGSRARIIAGGYLKPKDLCMIPNRLAIALQDDGWYVRSEIIWAKPNPMPESIRDRPTTSHEKIWLLSKSPKYWYDSDAVRQPLSESSIERLAQNIEEQNGSSRANGGTKTNGNMKAVMKQDGHGQRHHGFNERYNNSPIREEVGANLRNVWTIPTKGYSGAHFATFPPEIPERCILAGCPKGGTVLDPFGGSGTTGLVSDRLQRNAILIELNPEYIELSKGRILSDTPLFTELTTQ